MRLCFQILNCNERKLRLAHRTRNSLPGYSSSFRWTDLHSRVSFRRIEWNEAFSKSNGFPTGIYINYLTKQARYYSENEYLEISNSAVHSEQLQSMEVTNICVIEVLFPLTDHTDICCQWSVLFIFIK